MNGLFAGALLLAVALALAQLLAGHTEVAAAVVQGMFNGANLAVEVCLGLVGVLTLWSGLFRLAERSRLADRLALAVAPVLGRLMPSVGHHPEALGPVTLNLSANRLGLDNAATPLGLTAGVHGCPGAPPLGGRLGSVIRPDGATGPGFPGSRLLAGPAGTARVVPGLRPTLLGRRG